MALDASIGGVLKIPNSMALLTIVHSESGCEKLSREHRLGGLLKCSHAKQFTKQVSRKKRKIHDAKRWVHEIQKFAAVFIGLYFNSSCKVPKGSFFVILGYNKVD